MKRDLRRIEKAHRAVEKFNREYPVGSVVFIRPPFRRTLIFTFVITEPAIIGTDGAAVVRIKTPGARTFTMVPVKHVRRLDTWAGNRHRAGARR